MYMYAVHPCWAHPPACMGGASDAYYSCTSPYRSIELQLGVTKQALAASLPSTHPRTRARHSPPGRRSVRLQPGPPVRSPYPAPRTGTGAPPCSSAISCKMHPLLGRPDPRPPSVLPGERRFCVRRCLRCKPTTERRPPAHRNPSWIRHPPFNDTNDTRRRPTALAPCRLWAFRP